MSWLEKISLKKDQRGISLPELMIAVSIIGILSAVAFGGYLLNRPTRNFHAEGRDLISCIQMARVEAVSRATCVGIVFQPGVYPAVHPAAGYTVFVDDGAGAGGIACDAIVNGTENSAVNTIVNVTLRPEIVLTASPVAPTAADPNQTDLFTAISFNQRSLVAARIVAGIPLVLGNNTNAANITLWSRVVVFPSGGAVLQTNNNPANEANWD